MEEKSHCKEDQAFYGNKSIKGSCKGHKEEWEFQSVIYVIINVRNNVSSNPCQGKKLCMKTWHLINNRAPLWQIYTQVLKPEVQAQASITDLEKNLFIKHMCLRGEWQNEGRKERIIFLPFP